MRPATRRIPRRAAQAARVFAAAGALCLAGCGSEPPPSLPRLQIDPDRIAVAGLSSGAYMATQTHLAWSDHLVGAALVAGGPYGCAGGSLDTALGPCMTARPYSPDPLRLAERARQRAARAELAPLAGLAGDRVHVLHGRSDGVVQASVSRASEALYAALAGDAGGMRLRWDGDRDFGHVMPTLSAGGDCREAVTPYLGACGMDAAGDALAWLYGEPAAAATVATGELRRFSQEAYRDDGQDALLAAEGYLYLPEPCAAGERCGLLVVFHGCGQNADKVGDAFVREAGYNRWADVHRLVVLYPQTRSSYLPLNPKACWDWWGYTGPDYDTRRGVQQRWLAAAMAALGAPLK